MLLMLLLTCGAGTLCGSLVETDVDGLYADIVRQLLSTVLRLEDEETPDNVGLKERKGQH